jgi:hypothetical protein
MLKMSESGPLNLYSWRVVAFCTGVLMNNKFDPAADPKYATARDMRQPRAMIMIQREQKAEGMSFV